MLAMAEVLVAEQAERRLVGHEPALLLDHRPLDRRLRPGVSDDLLQVMAVEDATHHVLGAGLLAPLQDHDLEAGSGHRDRGRDAGGARRDHDRIKLLVPPPTKDRISFLWS